MSYREEFEQNAAEFVGWMTEYLNDVEKFPVRSQVSYGDIKKKLPAEAPKNGEPLKEIFEDFKSVLFPGITHWQSPKFFAYFPSNSSIPSILAEMLTATLGVQGMKWITSPSATELEELVTEWLRVMTCLPEGFSGVIQDSASVSTLCAIIAAREKTTAYNSNRKGIGVQVLRYYCSEEAHSSIEKAVRIAGIGSDNLVKIETDEYGRMLTDSLAHAIESDIAQGYKPTCVVAALGTTGLCALDPIREIGEIAGKYGCWYHIDAAFAGSALILPEFRETVKGLELADSFVFNPHKWLFTNFDCSLFYVKDTEHLQNTFSLVPEYLRTKDTGSNDYSNWGIQLGRRFRSLKLWFVIRYFGITGLQERLRGSIDLAKYFEEKLGSHPEFEIVLPRSLSVVCFRWKGSKNFSAEELNRLNGELLESMNATGKIYLSHTIFRGKYTLRFVCAQTNTQKRHVDEALEIIFSCAQALG